MKTTWSPWNCTQAWYRMKSPQLAACIIAGCSLSAEVWVFVASRTLRQHTQFPLTFLQLCFIHLFIYFQIESFIFVQHISNNPKLHLKYILIFILLKTKKRNSFCSSCLEPSFWIVTTKGFSYVYFFMPTISKRVLSYEWVNKCCCRSRTELRRLAVKKSSQCLIHTLWRV